MTSITHLHVLNKSDLLYNVVSSQNVDYNETVDQLFRNFFRGDVSSSETGWLMLFSARVIAVLRLICLYSS